MELTDPWSSFQFGPSLSEKKPKMEIESNQPHNHQLLYFVSTFAHLVRPDEFFVSTGPQGWRVTADWDSHCSWTCSLGSSAELGQMNVDVPGLNDPESCLNGFMIHIFFQPPTRNWVDEPIRIVSPKTKKTIHQKKTGIIVIIPI